MSDFRKSLEKNMADPELKKEWEALETLACAMGKQVKISFVEA